MTTTEFPAHDLVICSYSLGETGRENALRILRTAWHSTRQTIAIIEPGTMKGFDLIRTLREELIQLGGHIIAPCPHQKDCPMGGGDWCHFSARFERSSLHRQIKSGSLGYEDEKFAYIAASKQPICRPGARIIRHPEIHAGFIRLQLCAKDQLHTYTATRSDKAAWKRARKIGWGDAWE